MERAIYDRGMSDFALVMNVDGKRLEAVVDSDTRVLLEWGPRFWRKKQIGRISDPWHFDHGYTVRFTPVADDGSDENGRSIPVTVRGARTEYLVLPDGYRVTPLQTDSTSERIN